MNEKEVAKILLEIKAVTLRPSEPFKWVSGIYAPIYCDNRLIISYPEKRLAVVNSFLDVIKQNNLEFDVVAGTATAGISWAAWIAKELGKPMIYVRNKSKDHGKENQVEGKLEEGQKVLVVEDLISTGGSSFGAVEAIREARGIANDCIAIFTYEMEKSIKKFEEGKCNLFTLSNFSTLIKTAVENNFINEKEMQPALDWSKDPSGWGKKMGFE